MFIDGLSLGRSSGPGALLQASRTLAAGAKHAIVLRATKGSAGAPAALAELTGAFGRLGTGTQWKAKAATGTEASEAAGAWALVGFDDSGWSAASAVNAAEPAGFPRSSPATAIWTAQPGDGTVLLRLTLFVPSGSADAPQGFGRGATGGAGGEVVTVTTPAELAQALCGSRSGAGCTDATPRVIQLPEGKVFDFRGSEGQARKTACYVTSKCTSGESEYITGELGACDGKQTFQVDIDAAGPNPMLVGSNKTLVGLGAGATIRGKGLRAVGGVRNIVVRNLTITDINPQVVWGGDAITLDGASDVWIDHVRISLVGRQMLVTGWNRAANVTVSYSEFDGRTPYAAYCDGAHYWVLLLLGAGDTITFQGNWIHHASGRAPHVGGGERSEETIHLANTYYSHVTGHAVDPLTYSTLSGGTPTGTWSAKVLLEGTFFQDVKTPIQQDAESSSGTSRYGPGFAFAPLPSTLGQVEGACRAALGRTCVANVASPQSGGYWPLHPEVMAAFDPVSGAELVEPFPAELVPATIQSLAGPGHL